MKKPYKKPAPPMEVVHLSRPMPVDAGAQTEVLICFMDKEELLDEPFSEDWLWPKDGMDTVIYRAMKRMREEKRPIGYISLLGCLNDWGLMAKAGGNGNVAELMKVGGGSSATFHYHVDTLKQKHLERTIILSGVEMIESAYGHDPQEMAAAATRQLATITETIRGKQEVGMGQQLEEWMDTWHDIRSGKKESTMPTRWSCWNRQVMGIKPGYTVISGPRGSGKSTLAQNILTDACIHRGKAGISVNYEMPARMVINRIIADIGNIDGAHLFCPDLTKPTKDIERRISACLNKIKASKLQIVHDVSLGFEDVAHMARAVKAKHGSCMVLVDYQQIAPPPRIAKDGNREQEVAKNSGILRALSKELDDTVLGLSQLNKDGQTRESAAIESDADDCYRVERYKQADGTTSDDGVLVWKNRSGPDGMILPLSLRGEVYRFVDKTIPEQDDFP